MPQRILSLAFAVIACLLHSHLASAEEPPTRKEVQDALRRATAYFHDKVARHGGYSYYVDADLKQRWGEGRFDNDTIIVQPPGTPSVGMAYLKAYSAMEYRLFGKYALDAGHALVAGQLESGGWTQVIHFAKPDASQKVVQRLGKYRHPLKDQPLGDWNGSSLDDNQTQAALVFLMKLDFRLRQSDPAIHEAAEFGLAQLCKAQFANGGFPQVWTKPAPAAIEGQLPQIANYPSDDWRTARVKNYWDYPTLNDGLAGTVAEVLLTAHETYSDEASISALRKLGDFLILAQLPAPQPAWAQQYNEKLQPMWARKFEPPAITGSESQDVLETLLTIARHTKDKRYLVPIPRAIEYLRKSELADGKLARFYELKTNKPLYMDTKYQLTYSDSDVPAHYGWKVPSRLDKIERAYKEFDKPVLTKPKIVDPAKVRQILADLDAEGRWISIYHGEKLTGQPKFAEGQKYLASEVFVKNVEVLSEYLKQLE
jgi:PelA/Pel-15E family pectate lyase